MKTVVLIPIKLGSKRVPGKNIKLFSDGAPLSIATLAEQILLNKEKMV